MLAHFSEGVRKAMTARSCMDPKLSFDVGQAEVEEDPVGTTERIYQYFGLEMTDSVKIAMRDWAAENQRGSRGAHVYSAEEFGLTVADIRETFADYHDQFGSYMS